MEIRLIFFKEIVGVISLKKGLIYQYAKHLRSREEKSTRRFFLPKVSLISILQKSSFYFVAAGAQLRPAYSFTNLLTITTLFWPPNPKDSFMTTFTGILRGPSDT